MGDKLDIWNWWDKSPQGIDLKTAKERFGEKICFVTGIDQIKTLLSGGEEIENEAKQAIKDAGRGGGLVIAPGGYLT